MSSQKDQDEFTALQESDDARSIEEMISDDRYEEWPIEKVEVGEDNSYSVTFDRSTGTTLTMPEGKSVKVGDMLRLYPGGFGCMRHGFAINGEVIEWKTPWERFADRVKGLAAYDRRKREDFTKQQAELDRKYEALPAPLKARIDRFRAADPKFRMDAEAYEMAAVWDAPKIAEALRPEVDAGEDPEVVVNRFRDLSFEEQNAKVPGLDQGHSGNTFGGAVMLAYRLLAGLEC